MIEAPRIRLHVVFCCTIIFLLIASVAVGQSSTPSSQAAEPQKEVISDKSQQSQPTNVSGNWQVSWETRLGTDKGILHLEQDGMKLTGTFKDLHGLSSLTGTIDENQLTLDIQFQGPHPFTIRFKGTAKADDIKGISQAVNVDDGGGAFLGHGGEVVHPEHPWTAKHEADAPIPPTQTSATNNSSKN